MRNKVFAMAVMIISVILVQSIIGQNMMKRNQDQRNFSMIQKLDVTEQQQDQISILRIDHQMEMVDLKSDLKKKELELTQLKVNGNYNREEYLSMVEAICTVKDVIAISIANHKMDIYALLNTDQKKEWNKISFNCGERKEKRILRKMRESELD